MTEQKDLIWLVGGRAAQVLLLFLLFRVLTLFLPKDEVGLFFLAQAIAGGAGLVIINPVGTLLNREIHAIEKSGAIRMAIRRFCGFATLTAAVTVAGFLIFSPGHDSRLALAIGLYVLAATLANTFIPLFNLLGQRRRFAVLTVLSQALALVWTCWVLSQSWAEATALTWIVNFSAIQAAFGIGAAVILWLEHPAPRAHDRSAGHLPDLHSIWRFSAPISLANIAVWALTQGYRPIVERQAGLEVLAIVGLGFGLAASGAAALETLVHQIYLPRFYAGTHSLEESQRTSNWQRLWREVLPLYIVTVVFLIGFSREITMVMADARYAAAAGFFAIGMGVELLRMTGNLVGLLMQSERRTDLTVYPYAIGGATAVVSVFVLSSIGQTEWIGVGLLLGQLAALVGLILPFRRKIRVQPDLRALAELLAGTLLVIALGFVVPTPLAIPGFALLSACWCGFLFWHWSRRQEKRLS